MSFSRRKFIKTLALSAGSLLVPAVSFPNTFQTRQGGNPDITDLKRRASEAFYRREYDKAKALYIELISKKAGDISCYDGLAKIYYKQSGYLEAVDVFSKGLEKNRENPLFFDRLARSLTRLSLGNLKQESGYILNSGDDFLIKKAINLYLEAIEIAPDKKYLREGLLDAVKALEKKNKQLGDKGLPALVLDGQTSEAVKIKTSAYKGIWSQTRDSNKRRNQNLDESYLLKAIEKSEGKRRRKLYFDDEYQSRYNELQKYKAGNYQSLLLLSMSNNNTGSVDKYYNSIRKITGKNTFLKGKVVHFYKRTSSYQNLQKLYEEEIRQGTGSPWPGVCLAQLLLNKEGNVNKGEELLNKVKENIEPELSKIQGAVSHGLAKCAFLSKQYEQGRNSLLEGMNTIVVGGVVNSLIVNYAESYIAEGRYEDARNILLKMRGAEDVGCDKNIEDVIARMNSFMEERDKALSDDNKTLRRGGLQKTGQDISSGEELKALYSLAKMYQKAGDHKLYADVLDEIGRIDPNDRFLMKRK